MCTPQCFASNFTMHVSGAPSSNIFVPGNRPDLSGCPAPQTGTPPSLQPHWLIARFASESLWESCSFLTKLLIAAGLPASRHAPSDLGGERQAAGSEQRRGNARLIQMATELCGTCEAGQHSQSHQGRGGPGFFAESVLVRRARAPRTTSRLERLVRLRRVDF